MERYDFIVLGGGGAGLTAAHAVPPAGKKVAVVDSTPIGGPCALQGCNLKEVLVRRDRTPAGHRLPSRRVSAGTRARFSPTERGEMIYVYPALGSALLYLDTQHGAQGLTPYRGTGSLT